MTPPMLLTLDLRSDPQIDGERQIMTLQEAILMINNGRSLKHTALHDMRQCRNCGSWFRPFTGNQVYCTEACQQRDYNQRRKK